MIYLVGLIAVIILSTVIALSTLKDALWVFGAPVYMVIMVYVYDYAMGVLR